MISLILGAMNAFSLSLFENSFMYWEISLVVDIVSPERIVSC